MLGSHPLSTAAVIPFLATFGLLGVTSLALHTRAQAKHTWQPAVALSLALVSSVPTVLLRHRVRLPYRDWF